VALRRIGIDASCWWSRRGFGRFTRGLLTALFEQPGGHRYCLFVDRPPEPEMRHPRVDVVHVNTSRPVTEAAVAEGSRSPRDIWAFTRAASREPLDLMFYPAVYSWFPLRPGVPVVVTLHDAIAEHFPGMVFPDRKGRFLWAAKMRLARLQARRFLTVSNAAKREIVRHLGIRAERIDVVSEAPDARFRPVGDGPARVAARRRAMLPTTGRYIVYASGLAPHKNVAGLIDGFSRALAGGGTCDLHLVLAGDPQGGGFHSNYRQLLAQAEATPALRERVHFCGYVTDDELAALYSGALAAAVPSFSEGFGLPAVEAMACGTPVLASAAGSIPEVVGDAGLYFDPHDAMQIAQAIRRIATEPGLQADLGRRALARAARFTWDDAARLTIAHLERAVGGA
jgi:glycosyltransferase involved in cell wall biosynthesis